MSKPDFELLRTIRNAAAEKELKRFADAHGIRLDSVHSSFNPNSCYCDCPKGPCEHDWSGKPYENAGLWSATCARCGMTAMSHSLMVGI